MPLAYFIAFEKSKSSCDHSSMSVCARRTWRATLLGFTISPADWGGVMAHLAVADRQRPEVGNAARVGGMTTRRGQPWLLPAGRQPSYIVNRLSLDFRPMIWSSMPAKNRSRPEPPSSTFAAPSSYTVLFGDKE